LAALTLVNGLLTTSIKVNSRLDCRIAAQQGVTTMKKVQTARSFWDWLLGGGFGTTGGNG
jgi:hypothetical protein